MAKNKELPLEADRTKVPTAIQHKVSAEAGYKCGNPVCTVFVAIHYHHIIYVSEGGTNDVWNLLPLCPTCHARHHNGEIKVEAIRLWKGLLQALNQNYDRRGTDLLLYLWQTRGQQIGYSGDGLLQFAGLVAAGLVDFKVQELLATTPPSNYGYMGLPVTNLGGQHKIGTEVQIELSSKGVTLVEAWLAGDPKKANGLIPASIATVRTDLPDQAP